MSELSFVQRQFTADTETPLTVLRSFLFNKFIHFQSLITSLPVTYRIPSKSILYTFFTVLFTYLLVDYFNNINSKRGPSILQNIMNKFSEALSLPQMFSQGTSSNGGYGGGGAIYGYQSPEFRKNYKRAMKNGGFPGGLANDGNTCFMNSVIQCLASSQELRSYLATFSEEAGLSLNDTVESFNAKEDISPTIDDAASTNSDSSKSEKFNKFFKSFKSTSKLSNSERLKQVRFSTALLELIDSLNGEHGDHAPTYKTKELLRVMKDSPNKHLFLGYNQEDAQEFYQNVMKQVEKEFTDLEKLQNIQIVTGDDETTSKTNKNEEKLSDKFVELPENAITGLDKLGYLGDVYVPVSQIDPADSENENKYLPYKLVTPVDGLQCDRIGCLNCGEIGGIRYSVTSGLALNLPVDGADRNRFTLGELINEFCKPDVIDGVECNRCSLNAVRESLAERLENLVQNETGMAGSKLLTEKIQQRINEVDEVLSKKCIHDDIYEKLHTKNMVRKSRKVKQSYLSRPPALLCIHVNRSVFDPRTYMVRKNNAKIDFPLELDLSDFVASIDDINTDARLEFRKQDEETTKLDRGDLLKYKLKSVISHFGTHNYGHYIAFRKHKGNWWHISDEIVRLSTIEEVLGSQGTFMLFYEISNNSEYDTEIAENKTESGTESDIESEAEEDAEANDDEKDKLENEKTEKLSNATTANEFTADDAESHEHMANIQANL